MRGQIRSPGICISLVFGLVVIFPARNAAQECFDDGTEFCIYQEDILSVDLLPDSFLLIDRKSNLTGQNRRRIEANGTIDEAFNSMGFHRKKMNEFLCHGFLAEQILAEVGGTRVKRRLDNSGESDNPLLEYIGENNVSIHEKLLSDEGSSKYKDWLRKTTTLDDIYRHYAPRQRGIKTSKKDSADKRYDDEGEEYDGAVTGYAMPAPVSTGKIGGYGPSGGGHFSSPSGHHAHHLDYFDNHGDFYPQIHEEHYFVPNHHETYHHHEHHRPSYHHGKGKGHELSLKDFFEIALTALAFLAFGLFIIQLIMNVTNATTVTAAAFLQADIDGTRFKRDTRPVLSPLSYTGNQELNELSHRVLRSVEAVLAADQDDGNCLRRVLCEDNKQSRENAGGQRIWVPVWSLGMSWLSGRMLRKAAPWSTTLGSVKAAVMGLGGADCAVLFPDCDLEQEVTRSRRRRRRRKK